MKGTYRRSRLLFIAFGLVLVAAATGCDAISSLIPGSTGGVRDVKFISYRLRRDSGAGKPGAAVDAFRPADHAMYFEVIVDGDIQPGTKVKWVFTAVDTKAAKNQIVNQVEGDLDFGKSTLNTLSTGLQSQTDWSPGTYKVDIYLDTKLKFTIQYLVQ